MAENKIEIQVVLSKVGKFFTTPLNKVQAGLSKLGRKLNSIADKAKKLGKVAAVVGTGLGVLGGLALKAAGNFEKQRVAFETMLGSAEKADKLLKEIETFAATTPFQLPGLIEGSKRLLAFGVEADKVVDTMGRLGDLAQGDQEKLNRLTDAFGKLRAKGKATLEEINRFTEAGVPLVDELAKNYEVTTEEVLKLVSQGKVGFAEVEEAVQSLTSEGGKFFELTKKQSQTFNGLLSTTKDLFGLILKDVGEVLLPKAKEFLAKLIEILGAFRQQLPKFILGFKKFFIDLKATTVIAVETIKEIIASPFKFETYKFIFEEFLEKLTNFFGAIRDLAKGNFKTVKSFLIKIREEEKNQALTLEEEIKLIRKKANEEKLKLEQEFNEKILESQRKTSAETKENEANLLKQKEENARKEREIQKKKKEDTDNFNKFVQASQKSAIKEVSAIGKASALFQIAVDSRKAAMSAYSALAGIPIVGPALGLGAAIAALAFGAEQAKAVSSQTPGFEQGGIVPGNSFSGDNVPIRANSREGVFTIDQQKELFDIANGRREAGNGGPMTINLFIGKKLLAQTMVESYNESRDLNLIPKLSTE